MRPHRKKPAKDPLERVKIATAKARLAKLEAELPSSVTEPEFVRYEDLRPLHPDDRDKVKQSLIDALTVDDEKLKQEKHDWYMTGICPWRISRHNPVPSFESRFSVFSKRQIASG